MPWKACKPMDERLKFIARLLDGEPMAVLCREFGISRKTGYKILTRYNEIGLEGLGAYALLRQQPGEIRRQLASGGLLAVLILGHHSCHGLAAHAAFAMILRRDGGRAVVKRRGPGDRAADLAVDMKAQRRSGLMTKSFKVGDHVSWNSEAGRVRGRVVRVHASDVNYKGYVHHASRDDPQYEIKSDKTDHIALHKGRALRLLSR